MRRSTTWTITLLMAAMAGCGNDAPVSAPNVCDGVDCGEHGQCAQGASGPVCVCAPGYAAPAGGSCAAVPDACADADCGTNGTCLLDTAGTPICVCDAGFVRTADACAPVAPTADPCKDVDCGDGVCATAGTAPLCVCNAGFAADGLSCVEAASPDDPCKGIDCGKGACAVAGSTAVCICDSGYEAKGLACVPAPPPADPCAGVDCGNGACVAAAAGPVCLCDPGYTSTGTTCEPLTTTNPCQGIDCDGQGVCTATPAGDPLCVCKAGFESTGVGCAPLPDPCEGVTCSGAGACVVSAGAPLCICDPGTYRKGTECLPNVDPCSGETCDGHGTCVVTAQGPVCLCEPGFVADGAACVPTGNEPCDGITCGGHGSCMVSAGAPVCACDPGFTPAGVTCVPTDNPCADVMCGGLGECVVAASGNPVCLCDAGAYAVGLSCFPAPEGAIPETAASNVTLATPHPDAGAEYVPNDLLVYAAQGHDAEALMVAIAAEGASVVAYQPDARRYIVRLPGVPSAPALDDLATALTGTGHVTATSPVWVSAPAATPLYYPTTDTGWGYVSWDPSDVSGTNWYLKQVRAPNAWGYTTGSKDIAVGVIDHGEITNSDLDSLSGGWAPTFTVDSKGKGHHFKANDHGNKVSGVLAARGDNGEGLTGVLWNAPLYYCRTDGTNVRMFDCVRYLLAAGARIINYSSALYYRDPCSPQQWTCDFGKQYPPATSVAELADDWMELSEMPSDDWIFVQGAGNEALDAQYAAAPAFSLPDASVSERVLIVGAVTAEGALSPFSNRGKLHVVAPGGTGGFDANMLLLGSTGTTADWGTSFAAPLVAGAAALAWSVNPQLEAAEVVTAVREGSKGWGKTATDGANTWPLLDMAGAIEYVIAGCEANDQKFDKYTGQCGQAGCVPDCADKQCGDDGCGGTCGAFHASACDGAILKTCVAGAVATKDCGADGGTCGPAGAGHACKPGADAPPTGQILEPAQWTVVKGPFDVVVEAADDKGLVKTTIKVGNVAGEVYSDSVDHAGQKSINRSVSVDPADWTPGNYWIALWAADGVQAVSTQVIGIVYDPGCTPQCDGKECGPDGCGGECVPGCAPGQICGDSGLCKIIKGPAMIEVPSGPFWMGCNTEQDSSCDAAEQPYHLVDLQTFWIDKLETTVNDYATCVLSGPCATPAVGSGCNWNVEGRDDHPINCVPWEGAEAFCEWMGKRLCTEAEWEKAARGTDGRMYPWGNQAPSCEFAIKGGFSMTGCDQGSTWPVGSVPKGGSPYGLLDMAGNVWEWTADWYGDDYYSSSPLSDPPGPTTGSQRVRRGGGFDSVYSNNVATYNRVRYDYKPGWKDSYVGFRCCRTLP